jgi:ADP-ribose pyrophosphatase
MTAGAPPSGAGDATSRPDRPARAGISGPEEAAVLCDRAESWPVTGSSTPGRGSFAALRTDQVQMPDGDVAARDVIEHPGAVAVAALDGLGRVLLIRQYRHPVGRLLWELPAGLRDVAGEPLLDTAIRELREETGYSASSWNVLADCFTSPGILAERLRIFLARGVSPLPDGDRGSYHRRHEEAHLVPAWVPLDQAVALVIGGCLHNGVAAIGILAAYAARQGGFAALRDAAARED